MIKFLRYWLALFIYAGLIFYVSGISSPLPESTIPFLDKALHICEYTVFGFLASRAFDRGSFGWTSPAGNALRRFAILAIALSVIYGASDEFHQLFVQGRQFSLFDILADTIGGILGTLTYVKYCSV